MSGPVHVAVVDYGMGNRRSVQKAFEHVGARATITREASELRAADGIVVPGVGAFPKAMERLNELGMAKLIREQAHDRRPLLGICLGMQVLFERSVEMGSTEGLGLVAGEVTPLQIGALRVPHIGWNEVSFVRPSRLTNRLPRDGCPFYHVHSFAVRPSDENDVVGTCQYGETFATIVARGSIHGVQFHPEKSSGHGLAVLENFVRLCAEETAAAGRAAAA